MLNLPNTVAKLMITAAEVTASFSDSNTGNSDLDNSKDEHTSSVDEQDDKNRRVVKKWTQAEVCFSP